ncbi:MAG: ABC transporter ATP-binding protein, partial [Methanobacteriota archaeon]
GELVQIKIPNPREGMLLGIGMVYQHFQLVEPLTVAENITLGNEITGKWFIDREQTNATIRDLGKRYGMEINPEQKVEDLPVGLKQRVEILKQLYRKADLLILDEPTAVLTPLEVEELFETMKELKKDGKSMIFISHKLKEPLHIADRIVVMRKGRVVGETIPAETNEQELANLVVGKKVGSRLERPPAKVQRDLLVVENLTLEHPESEKPLIDNVSFTVRTHEILGVAGVEGNGQTELIDLLVGLRKPSHGKILFHPSPEETKDFAHSSTEAILTSGVAYIPEDRGTQGLVKDFSITENVWLAFHADPKPINNGETRPTDKIFLPLRIMKAIANKVVQTFNVKASSINQPVKDLSGGNQQKVILGREFAKNPQLVIASQPTRGVDIGVMEQVHTNLIDLRNRNAGILLVSADLDEVLKLSDRLIVMYEGKVVGEMNREEVDIERLSRLMISGEDVKKEVVQ